MCPCFVPAADVLGSDAVLIGNTLWVQRVDNWQCAFCGSTLNFGTVDLIRTEIAAAWRLGGADMVMDLLDAHPGEYRDIRDRLDSCSFASADILCFYDEAKIDRRPLVGLVAGG